MKPFGVGVGVAACFLAMTVSAVQAGGDGKTSEACLFANQVSGWGHVDDKTVVVTAGSRKFEVVFFSPCRQAKWAQGARVDSLNLCLRPGDSMTFSSTDGHHERCIVDRITPLAKGWTRPPQDGPAPAPGSSTPSG